MEQNPFLQLEVNPLPEPIQVSLRKWLSQSDRTTIEAVVKSMGLKHAMAGSERAMHPHEGKIAAARGDFHIAMRYRHFLEVLRELDSVPHFETVKANI